MFIALALIMQIGAFALHVHPTGHVHLNLSIDNSQSEKGQHCELCDAILKIAPYTSIDISILSTCTLLPYIESQIFSLPFLFSERSSSRAPPIV